MANPTRWEGDVYLNGNFQAKTLTLPAGGITDAHVAGGAGIQATKVEHLPQIGYSQPNTAATTETRTLHVVRGANGTVLAFRAGSIAPCTGAGTITVDLKKNGASILTAVITLNSASVARVAQAAVIATAACVAGDWLEVVITATPGGGAVGTGFFCELSLREDPN